MPDEVPILQRHHERALAQLGQWLPQTARADRLAEVSLRSAYPKRDFKAGWRVPADFSGTIRDLNVLVDQQFPYSQPRVALANPPPFLTWPHVEQDGVLCLPPRASLHDPIAETKQVLYEAYELVSQNIVEPPRQDFQDEFLSYWARDLRTKGIAFTSLIAATGPSRQIAVWRGSECYVVSDTEQALRSWFQNRFGAQKTPPNTDSAALIWLPHPLLPEEYPKSAADVWALAHETGDGRRILSELTLGSPNQIAVLIGAESKNGPCLAGITVSPPTRTLPGKRRSVIQNGFRKWHVPAGVVSGRYWNAATPILRSEVSRADASWVHGRGHDSKQDKLSNATVVIIGSGSIGAPVAAQLAMAGVGKVVIVDPEKLTAANTGRHPLGAKHINKYKAEALACELRQTYPHHQFDFRNTTWQVINTEEPKLLAEASLIVSATGDWNTEDALNMWHVHAGKKPPLVYGWTEEQACAGHAILIARGGTPCLACGLSAEGEPKFRVTSWPGPMLNQEPGCGALYQPYGPIEAAHTVNLVTELAIDALMGNEVRSVHRIWACRLRFLESCGGNWTPEWLALCGRRFEGGFSSEREWPRDTGCRSCSISQ